MSAPFDVFDVHHHVGRAFDALGGDIDAGESAAALELEIRLRIMDEGGVRQAMVIPGHGYLRPDGMADTQRVNRQLRYWEKVPELYDETAKVFEECLALIHEHSEIVDRRPEPTTCSRNLDR